VVRRLGILTLNSLSKVLKILNRTDLVDKERAVRYIKSLQNEDGSFSGDISGKSALYLPPYSIPLPIIIGTFFFFLLSIRSSIMKSRDYSPIPSKSIFFRRS